jgi:phenylpyruvate tautomerase PptA (4-oxalocrotonate tautomerase family)
LSILPLLRGADPAQDAGMPLLSVTVTNAAIADDQTEAFIAALTAAACEAESLPADAAHRCVLVYDARASGSVRFGGQPADELVRAVFVRYSVSDGVLDPRRRDDFASAVHVAAQAAAPGDQRLLHTSVIFDEVAEGRWARDGKVVRLPEMASIAGFEHLAHLARQ